MDDVQVTQIKEQKFQRPRLRERNRADYLMMVILIFAIVITIYTVIFRIEYRWDYFNANIAAEIASNFIRFDLVENAKKIEILLSLLNTLALGFVTTILGLIVGLIFGLFAARNLTNGFAPLLIRSTASLVRAVPTIIWVLIFVAGYGLTSTTAIVGMFFHTFAFFTKSFAEAFEEVDAGTIEALKASGANWHQIVFGAVFPSSLTKIISWIAIRNEINFGVAVVIGPAAGVPGTIGTLINNASRGGEYSVQGFGVFMIFLTALLMELLINFIRQKSIIVE
ncbi:MAG: ABC transporter permease subunit [Vallitaleaceae bacterium]|nr:ABC transporter permease subunit [Vallitaleaceae bacterium]